jgi:hypothetical protein
LTFSAPKIGVLIFILKELHGQPSLRFLFHLALFFSYTPHPTFQTKPPQKEDERSVAKSFDLVGGVGRGRLVGKKSFARIYNHDTAQRRNQG